MVDGTTLWSSISAKIRSLYSILDLLYFMLPYTMRHPTVLISCLNFSIVHGTFCFSHSISRIWHEFGQLWKFRLSKFCFQHPSSCIRLRSTSFRNPLRGDIAAGAANLHPHPTVTVAINPPVEWSRENNPTLQRSHVCLFNMAVPGSQT